MTRLLEKIVDRLEALQCLDNPFFVDGTFPAYRINRRIGYNRPDATLFFSAIICFSLQEITSATSGALLLRIQKICKKIISAYPHFSNKDGLPTYNFWQTKPSQHFPNGYLFHRHHHFKIPDDIDDTAFVYMTTPRTAEEYRWLKSKLDLHSNGSRGQVINTFPECRSLEAYSTWFGDKMYIEFDACALSNMLYCLFRAGMPPDRRTNDSLAYIRMIIAEKWYITRPFHCAHHYPRTSLIVYHVSRLIGTFDPIALRAVRKDLLDSCKELLQSATDPMERIILSISLLRLGVMPPEIDTGTYGKETFNGYSFFIAGLLTAYEHKWLYTLAPSPWVHMNWECEAHCWVLLAEYEYLRIRVSA
ncbi:hypothetical protein [Dyadobacter tibetensis]|uniref:hypothetical protein n=1 Tax=Dyadobacter tibetensis TaxID=1211851 RepID=UPI00046EA2FE|nr:hypothetical protein [Dyadobacter tibetensis]